MILSNFLNEAKKIKVIVFYEINPLTDIFEPIMLTHEQYVKLLDLIESFMPHKSPQSFQVVTNATFQIKVPNILDTYTHEEIEAIRKAEDAIQY